MACNTTSQICATSRKYTNREASSNATPRQLIAAFNTLLEALKANPNLQIDVLQRPVDIESGKSLKGSDVSLDDDKPHAFSLQITRKIKP